MLGESRARWMPAASVVLLALMGLAAACQGAPVEELLANKACAADGTCAPGYRCAAGVCLLEGSGGGYTGGAGPCQSITDCSAPANPCEKPVCLGGECGTVAVDSGDALPAADQVAGNCKNIKCDGLGHVVDENDDLDLPDDGLECTQDLCISGVADHRTAALGTTCENGGASCDADGNCVQCVAASDCTQLAPDDYCRQRACQGGACVMVFASAGTALPAQTAGDCQKLACDGTGLSVVVDDPSDGPDDGNDCTTDGCVAGEPDFDPLPPGTACQAGACNAAGQCTGCFLPTDCSGSDTFCGQRTCAASVCGFNYTNAGTALPASDQNGGDCQTLSCNGAGGVQSANANSDVPLDDGLQCTGQACVNGTPQFPPTALDAACNEGGGIACDGAGVCVACNSPGQCAAQGSVCEEATCVSNTCGIAPKPSGTPAKAGAQTVGDCEIVLCNGAGQANAPSDDNGDLPVDGNPCTNDLCMSGSPSNPPAMQGTPCGGGGQCNASGACGGATKPDGAPCVMGTECTSGDCVDGVCCENACASACSACSAAKTGGSDGDCEPIPVGQDPDVECSAAQTCTGAGACGFTCGQEPSAPGGSCPAACSGGCLDGTCIIACNTPSACKDDVLNCPAGFACTVECGANDACKNTTINCPSRYACNVECSVDCEKANVNCNTGVCNLTCGAGNACKTVDLTCGGNTCDATCNGSNELPLVACGTSCDCDSCALNNGQPCTGPAQCQSGICPGADDVCCNSSCGGLCRSCVGSATGAASGTCGFILAGTDPYNECGGAQTCNGNGACQP